MATENVSIRDLRNHGADVVDRVQHGNRVIVTRAGRPVAELRPMAKAPVDAVSLLERRRNLPPLDPDRFRSDIDQLPARSL
ncbi:MAG: prevent-host-death protein [Acidimicrobiales bacterium]|nr:prevent-host-death protein [Acidimicrobiales bacterium]